MEKESAIIVFNDINKHISKDLEVPLNISANELVNALNSIFNLDIDINNIKNCYLQCENPIILLKGNKTLKEFGIHNGTEISYTG